MRATNALLALTLTALAVAGPAQAQRPAGWTQAFAPFRIIGNVYYVGTAGLAVYLIKGDRGDVLIDGGLPENAPQVTANIAALGFKPADVKVILNTHAHFDHSGALAALKRETGASLVASEGDRWALENGKYLGSETVKAYDAPPVKVDRLVKDGEDVRVGSIALKANLTPGHTKGCTSWSMNVKDRAATRKVLFFCSATVAANRLTPNPQYPGIIEDYRATFTKVRTLKPDVYLAPHGEFFDLAGKKARIAPGKPNPFVDPTEFPKAVDKFEADFKTELARQQGAAK